MQIAHIWNVCDMDRADIEWCKLIRQANIQNGKYGKQDRGQI